MKTPTERVRLLNPFQREPTLPQSLISDTFAVESLVLTITMSDNDLGSGLSKLNINAPVFVPSFGAPAATADQQPSPAENNEVNNKEPPAQEIADDWEANADEETAMDEEDIDDEEEEEVAEEIEGDAAEALVKTKKVAKKRHRGKPSESEDREKKEHINIVFIGHVDAGKSTIGGQILKLTGMVDKRTLEKYEREAKEKNRESWYLSWALDTNQEERDKGKTVEVGRAFFTTEHKHFTLLDAPGHKGFVPNMISGAVQADVAVLVISARKGEFETGFERGGQTREHAMLVKTAGVRHLVILINKMDDPTVNWDEGRYNECKDKLVPFLKSVGFKPHEVYFMPCSGFTGQFLMEIPTEETCPWYRGPSFLDYLDSLPPQPRASDGPFRMAIADKYKDMGTIVMGKVESGQVKRGASLLMMPNRRPVEVLQLWADDDEVSHVVCGENVKIKLKGVEEEDVTSGFVLCDSEKLCRVAKVFDAQVRILETKSIITKGYSAVLHINTTIEEVTVLAIAVLDPKTGKRIEKGVSYFTDETKISQSPF